MTSQSCTAPIVIKGKKFFNSETGEYVPIKGIDYYPRPNAGELGEGGSRDYFSEELRHIWERDIEQFKALNVNAIRLYAVDPGADHDAFMCALQDAGIYVMVGLAASCENCAITEDESPACYPAELKDRGQYIINVFSKYPNVLAFDAGNEVNLVAPAQMPHVNAPCQKQFIRDMRAYISGCDQFGMRQIPLGLVIADVERTENALYYGCQTVPDDDLEIAEWYGINTYIHCDGSATSIEQLDGYKNILADFASYGLSYPIMLTEFGCLNPSFPSLTGDDGITYEAQRTWLQVEALFDPQYETEFNGGFVFEYSTEKVYSESDNAATSSAWPFDTHGPGNYGVGYFEPIDCDDIDINCNYVPFPQFDLLAAKYAAVSASGGRPTLSSYIPEERAIPTCPSDFPALDEFVWPSASQEDRVCWDDGGFKCPACGGPPLGSKQITTSPAPTTAVPDTTMTPEPSTVMPTTEPSTAMPDTMPSPSTSDTSPEPTTSTPAPSLESTVTQSTGVTTPSPVSAPFDLANLPDSFLDSSCGGKAVPRSLALFGTICALLMMQ